VSGSTIITGSYIAYALAAIIVFLWRPPLQAALLCIFAGWLFLPVADYPVATITSRSVTMDVIGTLLPSNLLLTKALVIPVVVLACLALTAPDVFRGFRPKAIDAAIGALCLSPMLAALAGRIPIASALVQAGYLAAVWGGSWMIGRLLLRSQEGRRALMAAIVLSGLVLVPVAVIEGLTSPWLYSVAYGAHPFQTIGAVRYVGFRPLGFFEDGNQYGIWMAMAALVAVFRALRRHPRSSGDAVIACVLVLCSIASQSVGAIVLLAVGAAWLVASNKARRVGILGAAILLAIGGAAYLSARVPLQHWVKATPSGQKVVAVLKLTGRQSLAWRAARDQVSLPLIYRAPLTGYGTWDWWRPVKSHPWGLPLLLAGQFGLLALALATISLLTGAVRELWQGSRSVLPVVVVLATIDAWLNSYAYFPAILAAAALAEPFWKRQDGMDRNDEHGLGASSPAIAETGVVRGR
jgi:hypothetical protein